MAVAPDLLPIAACFVGLVLRRGELRRFTTVVLPARSLQGARSVARAEAAD
jgi:hypothetical protein